MSVLLNWNKLNHLGSDDYLYPGRKLRLIEMTAEEILVGEFESSHEEKFNSVLIRKRSNSFTGMDIIKGLEENKDKPTLNKWGSDDNLEIPKDNKTNLRDKLRATLSRGGNISDIDKIFEHVINESKRVSESLKAVAQSNKEYNPRKSFLAFYETASKGNADNGIKHFIEIESENKIIKSEAYYCTKHGKVKGLLTIADTYIMFDPLYWEENGKYDQNMLGIKFQAWIDIKDVVNVDVIKLPNETAIYIQDDDDRQCYLYDYYLQFSVSVVNAKTLKKMLDSKKK
jgi:hypothetical protein